MKKKRITWMVGSVLCASLVIAAPANAAKNGNARIAAAKRYHVTQISERDVVVAQSPRARAFEKGRPAQYFESDVQLVVVRPNEEMQRVVLLPNPDAKPDMQLMVVRPNEGMQRVILLPNPGSKPDMQ